MKNQIIPLLFFLISIVLPAQVNKSNMLQDLEKNNNDQKLQGQTATLISASRLFSAKNDLTSVIMVLPVGSVVNILDSDSTYYHVTFQDNDGYIFKKHAVIDETPGKDLKSKQQQTPDQAGQQNDQVSRFTYLENKYGTSLAALLNAGKIWKGMTGAMVRDSWGPPAKISKTFEGNLVKEEWLYKNTWLYIENDILSDWGPIKR